MFTNEKRYHTLNNYYKNKYNSKVFKISLNAGFSCPSKCTYCSESESGDFAGDIHDNLRTQFNKVKESMTKKWKDGLYIAYLQAGTNTYSDIDTLTKIYNECLMLDKDVIGLSISTRPDCFSPVIFDLLEQINKDKFVQVEIGLQTIKQSTLSTINRQHDTSSFETTVKELRKRGIEVVVHIINGLPYETKEDMLNTIKYLSKIDIQGIKIHMLHVMKNTKLHEEYLNNPFDILTLEQYVDIVVNQLRLLPSNIVIHRVTGDAPRDLLVAPEWTLKKFVVMNEIDKIMRNNNYEQGDLYVD